MSADPKIVVEKFKAHLEGLGLNVFLGPLTVDPADVGLRLFFSGFEEQGDDREKISLEGALSGRGVDPGRYLSLIISHSRIVSKLLKKGFEYPLSDSCKAKAEMRRTAEGRFQQDEAEDKFDWSFQENYRIELSYNPAVLDHPELAV